MDLKKEVKEEFIRFQRNEKTESIVYERLASIEKDESNRKVLRLISAEEKSALCHTEEIYGNRRCTRQVAYSQILLAGKNPGYYICH